MDVAITPSLHGALRRFQKSDKACYLWADALCISQHDDEERSFQVRDMFMIFSKASGVLAWLGEETEFTPDAMCIMDLASSSDWSPGLDESDNIKQDLTNNVYPGAAAGLLDLYSRPWLSRAWVQQEILAAKQLDVYCGSCSFTFQGLQNMGTLLNDVLDKMPHDALVARNLSTLQVTHQATEIETIQLSEQRKRGQRGLCKFRHRDGSSRKPKPRDRCTRPECILTNLRDVLASDPRDRIYALLALMDCQIGDKIDVLVSSSPPTIAIDYSLSTSQVFQMLAKYLINRDQSWELLELLTPNSCTDLTLPTWTPDWRTWSRHRLRYTTDSPNVSATRILQRYDDWDVLRLRAVVYAHLAAGADGSLVCYIRQKGRPPKTRRPASMWFDDRLRKHKDIDGADEYTCIKLPVSACAGDTFVTMEGATTAEVVLRLRSESGYTFAGSLLDYGAETTYRTLAVGYVEEWTDVSETLHVDDSSEIVIW